MNNIIDILNTWDSNLFLLLNGLHWPLLDQIMFWFSEKYFWIPLYILFIFLLIKYYKKQSIFIILSVIVLITLSDQISVHLFKNVFQRLRPCHEPALDGLVHLVNNKCGGQYGFYSSHASNHFALATLLFFLLKNNIKYIGWMLFLWASVISYSRIYLGVHYPTDIMAGALMGTFIGLFVWKMYSLFSNKLINNPQ